VKSGVKMRSASSGATLAPVSLTDIITPPGAWIF